MKPVCAVWLGATLIISGLAQQAPAPETLAPAQKKQAGRRTVTAEERQKVESALPARAPAKPHKPRKLLVVDYRGGHPSVPCADLAVELMGAKTGAYQAIISHDTSLLSADQLKEFDAVYLNNTVGDIFPPELREGFAAYIRNGGGLVANHGSSVASPDWPEFAEILGARGAAHRAADEKIFVKVNDPSNPINAVFGGKGFEFTEEIFRFTVIPPRGKVHTLLSIDVAKTDMNQGRCTSNCVSRGWRVPDQLGPQLWEGSRVLLRAGS